MLSKKQIKRVRERRLAALVDRFLSKGLDRINVGTAWGDFPDANLPNEVDIHSLGTFITFCQRCGLSVRDEVDHGCTASMLLLNDAPAQTFLQAWPSAGSDNNASMDFEDVAAWTPVHAPVDGSVDGRISEEPRGCRVPGIPSHEQTALDFPLRPVTLDTSAALHALGAGWDRVLDWAGADEDLVLLEVHEALERLRCGAEQDGDRLTLLAGGIALGQRGQGVQNVRGAA